MKVFKKTALLLSVIVLAVVLSIGVIAGVAQAAEGDATLGEVYSAVQVTTDGKVNLKVFYSDLGSATGFRAEVVDPVTGNTDKTYTYTVEELGEATANGYCVKVPLTPSQMTHTVKVTATAGDEKGSTMEFTVADYAKEVLANAELAEYHDAMRMLLNWGAYAQNFFGDATANLANVNVFARGTNPAGVVGAANIAFPEGENDDEAFKTANLELSQGTIAMNFTVNLGTEVAEDEIFAMYMRDGLDDWVEIDINKVNDAGLYSISIRNISANNWGKIYTIYVVAGEAELLQDYSVAEYLNTMVAGDYTDAQKNVAKSMYQFYQVVTGDTGAGTCKHGDANTTYWVAADADSAYVKCSYCHAQVSHTAVSNSVNGYAPGAALQSVSNTGSYDETYMVEDGVQFVRFDNFWPNRSNWGDIGGIASRLAGKQGVTGQYLVIKFRVGAESTGTKYFDIYANTNKGTKPGLVSEASAKIATANDNQWHTVVINLAERVKDPATAFAPEEDGESYDIRYFGIRLMGGASTVENDDADGRYYYTYYVEDGEDKDTDPDYAIQVNGKENRLTAQQMEESGYIKEMIHKCSVATTDAYVDIAYMATCDSEAEARSLITSETYELSVANDKNVKRNTADGSCAHTAPTYAEKEGGYEYVCAQCGEAFDVEYFNNTKFGSYNSGTDYHATITDATDPAGFTYKNVVIDGNSSSGTMFSFVGNRFGQEDNYTAHALANTGRYLVVKLRGTIPAGGSMPFCVATEDTGVDSGNNPKQRLIGKLTAETMPSDWTVLVIDLNQVDMYSEGTSQKVAFTSAEGSGGFISKDVNFDIAYVAIVNKLADLKSFVADETVRVYAGNVSGEYVTVNTETTKCVGDHAYKTWVNLEGELTYGCVCGDVKASYGMDEGAATRFLGATDLNLARNGQTTFTVGADNGVAYIRLDNAAANSDGWMGWQPIVWGSGANNNVGRYAVIKLRIGQNGLGQSKIQMYTETAAGRTSGSSWVNAGVSFKVTEDNQWHTVVIDLQSRVPNNWKAGEDGTYVVNYFQMRQFTGCFTSVQPDDYMDVSYIAFCNSIDDLKNIISEETYEYSVDGTTSGIRYTSDNTCVEHAYAQVVDGNNYSIQCTLCSDVLNTYTVSSDINWYANLSSMGNYQHSLEKVLIDEEEGVAYNRYSGNGGNHLNFTGGIGTAGSPTSGKYPTGKYLAFKYRAYITSGTGAYVGLNVATGDKKSGNGVSMGSQTITDTEGEWKIAFIDVSQSGQWTSDGTNQSVYVMATTGDAYVFDIAWLIMVDSAEEMKTLMRDDETYYYYGTSWGSAPAHLDKNGECLEHSGKETVVGTVHTISCPTCGKELNSFDTKDVNYSASLESMNFFNGTSLSKNLFDSDEFVFYNRYSATASTHWNFTGGGGAGSPTSGTYNSGSYIIMKVRAWGENVTTMDLYLSTDGTTNTGSGNVGYITVTPEEGWTVIILKNPANTAGKYALNTDAKLYFMGAPGKDRKLDIAYLAVTSTLDGALALLQDGETYKLYEGTYSNYKGHLNADGTCYEHSAVMTGKPSTRVEGENTVYYYACAACGQDAWTRVAPTGTTVIDHADMMTQVQDVTKTDTSISTHFGMTSQSLKAEENPYFTFNGNTASHKTGIFIWSRSLGDNGSSQSSPHECYSIDVGKARFLVMKIRADIADLGDAGFTFKISSTGATGNDVFCLPANQFKGEWMTIVIDLETACTKWVADETTGNYLVDSFWFSVAPFFTTDSIDMEYLAFVEGDWSDVDTLVEEETVLNMLRPGTNAYDVVNVADGSKKD